MQAYFKSYVDLQNGTVHGFWTPFAFFFFTIAINFCVVSKGLTAGIERLAKIGMPILFVFAAILVVRVLTLGTHDVMVDGVLTQSSPIDGLNFMYTPNWSLLGNPKVWLAATGQIFFTLSVGMGSLQAYASYLKKKDDIALSGIATAATNETAEVVLGGSLAIPAIVTFFGVAGATAIAKGGSFDLGFIAMPLVFNQIPGGPIVAAAAGVMWFGLLFFAGITSSVAMATPALSFVEENFGWTRKKTAWVLGAIATLLGLLHIVYLHPGLSRRVGLLGRHLRTRHPRAGRDDPLRLGHGPRQHVEGNPRGRQHPDPDLLQVRHDLHHAGLPARDDDLVDHPGGGADPADVQRAGRPAHGALGVARADAGHPALPALAHQGGLAPPRSRRQGGGPMNTTALIFMAGAWIFVLGLTLWSFRKLMSTEQDEKLPPPGSIP